MLVLYSGTPGSGKSLHVAMVLYNRLKKNLPCIANFKLRTEKISADKELPFTYVSNKELSPRYLIKYAYEYFPEDKEGNKIIKESSILLVVDEAALLWSARTWAASGREEWNYFFSQHRKYGYDIILIAQFDGMIDKYIRSMIEYNIIHRKVSNFGKAGKIINFFSGGGLCACVRIWYPLNEKVGSEFIKAKKKYFAIYDTFGDFLSKDQFAQLEKEKQETLKARALEKSVDQQEPAPAVNDLSFTPGSASADQADAIEDELPD